MGTDKQEEEDDGRVIADMSGIETPSLFAPFPDEKRDGREKFRRSKTIGRGKIPP